VGRLALVAVALAVGWGCGGNTAATGQRAAGASAEARSVQVAEAREESLTRSVTVSGTLAAEEQAVLSFKVPGRLETLLVDLGTRVSAGQPVARLVPADFDLRVSQADAALQQARVRLGIDPLGASDAVDLERTAVVREARAVLDEARLRRDRLATFVDRGISSRAELDSAEAALKVADSRYQDALEEVRTRQALLTQRRVEHAIARQQQDDATLNAPFAGMIRERTASLGQFLAAGTPVATLVRVDPLRLRLDVPEREAARVRAGQTVRVRVEGDATDHAGRVVRLSPAITEDSRTLAVEVEVPNRAGRLRPGAFATADIVVDVAEMAVIVPASAIVTFAGIDKVVTIENGKALEKRVELGRREGDRVEVVEGLRAGERVVVEPGNLVSGDRVEVR
jgi:RND family efflux transporter MFP subunit